LPYLQSRSLSVVIAAVGVLYVVTAVGSDGSKEVSAADKAAAVVAAAAINQAALKLCPVFVGKGKTQIKTGLEKNIRSI